MWIELKNNTPLCVGRLAHADLLPPGETRNRDKEKPGAKPQEAQPEIEGNVTEF